MNDSANDPASSSPRARLTEVRFSLRELLAEVAEERASGALGAEKLHQRDIRKLFHPQAPAGSPRGQH